MKLGWMIYHRFVLNLQSHDPLDYSVLHVNLVIPYFEDKNNPSHIKILETSLIYSSNEVPKGIVRGENKNSYYVEFDNQPTFDEKFPEYRGQIPGYPILKEKVILIDS